MNQDTKTTLNECHPYYYFKSICWSAVMVGALVGIGLNFLFTLFCSSIGLAVLTTSKDGATALAIGGFIGLLISVSVAMFVAGMTSGYLARPTCTKHNLGILYGFTTWSFALVVTVFFASHMSQFVTSYTNYIYNRPAKVNVINNETSPAVSATTETNPTQVTINQQKAVNDAGYAAFLIFILFFAGALSSCIGGYCGIGCNNTKKWDGTESDDGWRKNIKNDVTYS